MANSVFIEGATYKHITTASTVRLSNAFGILHGISLNTNGATVTVYDNAQGTGTVIGVIAADAPEGMYLESIRFNNGLSIVPAGTVDITVVYSSPQSSLTVGSISPSASPSVSPSKSPSTSPSVSVSPSVSPSTSPSVSVSPSLSPSASPSVSPSKSPSVSPSASPSTSPSVSVSPSASPSTSPSSSVSPSPSSGM